MAEENGKILTQYRDNLWLLGGAIIRKVFLYEEYPNNSLEKVVESVIDNGIYPDYYD
jgi:hypothetical protein